MEASVVDLRYKMADVLKALERNEPVRITHRGKLKGIIQPPQAKKRKAKSHAFFGMLKDEKKPVRQIMNELRGGRYRDL